MKRRSSFVPILLAVLALGARLAFLWLSGAYGAIINSDGERYARLALSLLAGDGFAWGPGEPTAHRLFGYPWLLAAVVAICGPSMAAVQWVQAVLGSAVVLPVVSLGRRLGGEWTGVLAGLAVALHPVLIYLAGLAAPDGAALACEMGLVWCAWIVCGGEAFPPSRAAAAEVGSDALPSVAADSPRNAWPLRRAKYPPLLAWAGFVASGAVGILLRPELLLVVWLIPLAVHCTKFGTGASAGLPAVREDRLKARFLRSAPGARALWAAAAAATALAVLPPVARNAAVFGEFIPLPTIGGATFWCGNNAAAAGGCVNPSAETWAGANPPTMGTRGWPGLTETQSQARFYRAAFEWLRSDPAAAIRLLPKKLARSWSLSYGDEARPNALPRRSDWLQGQDEQDGQDLDEITSILLILGRLLNAAFGLAALAGAVLAWRKCERLLAALLLAPAAAWLVKTLVFYGSARQTAAVLPVAAIFAGAALTVAAGRVRGAMQAARRNSKA